MNQLVIQHNVDGSFNVIRFTPEFKSVPSSGPIVAPTEFPAGGTEGANLASELRWLLEKFLDWPFDPRTQQAERATVAMQAWGEAAFNALFDASKARDLYNAAISSGLASLRLIVSSDDPEVLSWPWELLYDPDRRYIATDCDIERKLTKDVGEPSELPETLPRDRVNILLVTCRPDGENDVGYRSISRSFADLVHASAFPAEVTV